MLGVRKQRDLHPGIDELLADRGQAQRRQPGHGAVLGVGYLDGVVFGHQVQQQPGGIAVFADPRLPGLFRLGGRQLVRRGGPDHVADLGHEQAIRPGQEQRHRQRRSVSGELQVLAPVRLLAPALLAALVVTQAFGSGRDLALDARAAGLAAAVAALLLRAPILVIIASAAVATALVRMFA